MFRRRGCRGKLGHRKAFGHGHRPCGRLPDRCYGGGLVYGSRASFHCDRCGRLQLGGYLCRGNGLAGMGGRPWGLLARGIRQLNYFGRRPDAWLSQSEVPTENGDQQNGRQAVGGRPSKREAADTLRWIEGLFKRGPRGCAAFYCLGRNRRSQLVLNFEQQALHVDHRRQAGSTALKMRCPPRSRLAVTVQQQFFRA